MTERKDEHDRTQRLEVRLSADELAAVEEFRFENRMLTKSEAVRELLRPRLAAIKEEHSLLKIVT